MKKMISPLVQVSISWCQCVMLLGLVFSTMTQARQLFVLAMTLKDTTPEGNNVGSTWANTLHELTTTKN